MIKIYEKQYRNYGIDYGMVTLVKRGEKMVKLTDEEEQIKEVIIAARTLEEYLWGEYMANGILKNGVECLEKEFKRQMTLM